MWRDGQIGVQFAHPARNALPHFEGESQKRSWKCAEQHHVVATKALEPQNVQPTGSARRPGPGIRQVVATRPIGCVREHQSSGCPPGSCPAPNAQAGASHVDKVGISGRGGSARSGQHYCRVEVNGDGPRQARVVVTEIRVRDAKQDLTDAGRGQRSDNAGANVPT